MKLLHYAMQSKDATNNIRNLLKRNEIKNAITLLEHKHNTKLEAEVQQMFGIDMRIPSDMRASKKRKRLHLDIQRLANSNGKYLYIHVGKPRQCDESEHKGRNRRYVHDDNAR